MFKRRLFFIAVGFLLKTSGMHAQSDYSFALSGGLMYYNGDLSSESYFPPLEIIRPFIGVDVSVLLVDRLDLSLRYMHGSVEGDDALSEEKDNLARNQSFHSNIDEASLLLRLRAFRVKKQRAINPYGMFGIGYFWFNPKANYNGKEYALQPLGTEGQFIKEGGYPAPYDLHSASLTAGLGIFFRVNDMFSVRLEFSPQLTFTDYLDDVSMSYPDSAQLAGTPNGAMAVLLSSRRPRGFPVGGRSRGNPERDDVIVTFGLSVVYTPASKSNANTKLGVFHKIFKGRKGWWGQSPD